MGVGFGTSYALEHIDSMQFVRTRWWKKLIRASVGLAVVVAISYLKLHFPREDIPSQYFFFHMLPFTVETLFIYGYWPVICA